MNPRQEAARSLAARLARAVAERWDRDRCDLEARGFLAELGNRGWRHTPPDPAADWRTAPRAERDPARAKAHTDELRFIARQARESAADCAEHGALPSGSSGVSASADGRR